MKNRAYSLLLATALFAGADTGLAQGVRLYGADEVPDAREVANMLQGLPASHAGKPRMKMRGISLDTAYSPAYSVQDGLDEVAQPTEDSFALPVRFAFDSADILPGTAAQLDAVAEGIKMVQGIRVVVEGHTDAHGIESYNRQLSEERAAAVKRYLVSRHGIDASRLVINAKGESAPINANDPFAAENRRVQFRAAK